MLPVACRPHVCLGAVAVEAAGQHDLLADHGRGHVPPLPGHMPDHARAATRGLEPLHGVVDRRRRTTEDQDPSPKRGCCRAMRLQRQRPCPVRTARLGVESVRVCDRPAGRIVTTQHEDLPASHRRHRPIHDRRQPPTRTRHTHNRSRRTSATSEHSRHDNEQHQAGVKPRAATMRPTHQGHISLPPSWHFIHR